MPHRPSIRVAKPASSPEEAALPVVATVAAAPEVGSGAAAHPAESCGEDPASCPFGVPVKLVDAAGHSAIGIRDHYGPYWLNASRSGPLGFNPVSWGKI